MQSPMFTGRSLSAIVGLTITLLFVGARADEHTADHKSSGLSTPDANVTGPLECYQCNSNYPNQTECQNNNPDALKDYLKPCHLNINGQDPIGCWKQTFLIPFNQQGDTGEKVQRVIRACAYSKPDKRDDDDACAHQSEFGTTSNQCFCQDSACNHAPKIDSANFVSILFSLFVSVALSMLFR